MLFYLLLSCLLVNGMHGYLLWSQRSERKWSISVHALKSRNHYVLYVFGHVVGGLFFVLFSREFFLKTHDAYGLFYLALITYFFEAVQSVLPSKGKWEMPHSIAALVMWICFLALGLISIVVLDVEPLSRLVATILYVPISILLVRAFMNRSRLYFYQMSMVLLFFAAMCSLVLGS